MRDAFEMWRSTRMIVLTALCAALYAALLIPFKAIVLIPSLTEARPASALPIVLGLLFGPAAAWGAAFGNLLGDLFGTLTPGSFFGFIGNFLFAYVPYRLWLLLSPPRRSRAGRPADNYRHEPRGHALQLPLFILVTVFGSAACAVVIAWGVDLLGLAPYHVLGTIITLNNSVPAIVLGVALLPLLYYRSRRWGLLVSQNLSDQDLAPGKLAPLGALLLVAGCLVGVALAVQTLRAGESGGPPAWAAALGSPKYVTTLCAACILIGTALLGRLPSLRTRAAAVCETTATETPEVLAVRGVTFRYPTWPTPALQEVELSLERGGWLTVVGPTGAGKSTLCLCLAGVIPTLQDGDFAGEVEVCGLDTRKAPVHEVSLRLGSLFQHFESQLFCSDVRSEIAFALEQRGLPREVMAERVEAALRAFDLQDLERADPAALSGGQKQRLALAALLAAEPDVIVLDEPTTDLDPLARRELMRLLAQRRDAGIGIVLVENDLWPPEGDERIAVLNEGRLRCCVPVRELLSNPASCRKLGLRPLPLPDLFERLGSDQRPLTVAEAVEAAASDRWQINETAWAELTAADVPETESEVLIEVRGLRRTYGELEALSGVDLTIRRGEFVALLGPNGAGKTTLARHLNGLLKPQGGQVIVAGQDTAKVTPAQLSRTVGYLFQDPDDEIFSQSVSEEVAFGLRNLGLPETEINQRVTEALEWTGLADLGEADPFTLTRGERQQVALAAVLALRPEVVVVDEPTTGLDGVEQVRMMERLAELNRNGHTIIMITHATWAAAGYARRVVLLAEGGTVLADGPPRTVFGAEAEVLDSAHQVLPEIAAFSRAAFGRTFLSVDEAARCLTEVRS